MGSCSRMYSEEARLGGGRPAEARERVAELLRAERLGEMRGDAEVVVPLPICVSIP